MQRLRQCRRGPLGNDHFTGHAHRIAQVRGTVRRCIQSDLQTPARRTSTTSIGLQTALDEQTIVGTQGDPSAIGGHTSGALPTAIEHGLRTRRFQSRTLADDDVSIGSGRRDFLHIDLATDNDRATLADLAVDAAQRIDSGRCPTGDIDQGMFTDPDRTVVRGRIGLLQGRRHINRAELLLTDIDNTAPGVEFTIKRDLACPAQTDALAGIDTDP